MLCYGVENATTLALNPPVDKVWPALTRCIQVAPATTTKYTLTARNAAGAAASQTVALDVGPPKAKFLDISINSKEVKPGEQVSFCFKAQNAVTVRGGPGKFMRNDASHDCLIDRPKHTTTYKMTITGAGGDRDEAEITVTVR